MEQQEQEGGQLFDLSRAAKRRMRLISWLAFGVLFLAVRRRHRRRRCQIAECRARYLSLTPDLLLPQPPWLPYLTVSLSRVC